MNLCLKYAKQLILILSLIGSINVYAYHTVNYNAKNGIVSNAVRKIYFDNTHRLWLGTDNGISLLTSNGITNYVYSNGLRFNKVWDISQCQDNSLWFGTFGKGLYEFRNDRFINYPLPRSYANNCIRKLHSFKKLLFIGTEAGLNAFDYKTHKFIPFKNISKPDTSQIYDYSARKLIPLNIFNKPDSFQILDFFEHKGKLYFQSFKIGTFEVNYKDKTFKKIRFIPNENIWNYCAYTHNDSLYLARTHFIDNENHNLLRCSMDDYLKGLPMDSIQMKTIIWEFAHTSTHDMYASCWGVRDDSGGLYRLKGKSMVMVNDEMGVSSKKLWDICYDKISNKLYVGSIDQGLFIVDLNQIVVHKDLVGNTEIRDLKIINREMYVLTSDKLIKHSDGKIATIFTYKQFENIIKRRKPVAENLNSQLLSPLTLRDISFGYNCIAVNSNLAVFRFDLSLNFLDYIYLGSDSRACFMKNNDALIFRDFGNSELYEDFGKGKFLIYKYYKSPNNPRDVNQYCKINDSIYLCGSENSHVYIYKQNSYKYKRFNNLGDANLPSLNDRISDNQFILLDKSNVLYNGKYTTDTLILSKLTDLKKCGIVESYFVKYLNGMIVVANNRGLLILNKQKTYIIDEKLGLPDNLVLKTAQWYNDQIYLATSAGIYTIDVKKLQSIHVDYSLSNLIVVADGNNYKYQEGSNIQLKTAPKELVIGWEINNHPYPDKLSYSFRTNKDKAWYKITTLGHLRFFNPEYGTTSVYIRLKDDIQGNYKIFNLVNIEIIKPFYIQLWFIVLLVIMFVSTGFILFYRIRIIRLTNKSEKAIEDKVNIQLKLDTIQFLLKPHFIFNALTSIQNLMLKNDIDKSLEYSGLFSKFLRGIMQNDGDNLITLDEELKNINSYIELEKLRFNENIKVEIEIEENLDVEQIHIIPFLFQPLIENIFKHAFTTDTINPKILIAISQKQGSIECLISDNGIGIQCKTFDDLVTKSNSKGLKITKAQLDKFFTNQYTFKVSENSNGGVLWKIIIPLLSSSQI